MNHVKSWAIAITLAIIIGAVYEFYISPKLSFTSPIGHLIKCNNINYAPQGKVEIYFINPSGCPMGAAISWPLYLALKEFGSVKVVPYSSKIVGELVGLSAILPADSSVPGLLIINFSSYNDDIIFRQVLVYAKYVNGTLTSTIQYNSTTSFSAIYEGLKEVQQSTPPWIYQIVYKTEIEEKLLPTSNGSVAFTAHHLVAELIITGPRGTWIALLTIFPVSPRSIVADTGFSHMSEEKAKEVASIMLSEINLGKIPKDIKTSALEIENIINVEIS